MGQGDQVQVGPGRPSDRRVVALALGVIFAFDHVEGQCALIAGDAVDAGEVEDSEEVADAKGAELGDPLAADDGEARGEAVSIVSSGGRTPNEETLHPGFVDLVNRAAARQSPCVASRAAGAEAMRRRMEVSQRWKAGEPARSCRLMM